MKNALLLAWSRFYQKLTVVGRSVQTTVVFVALTIVYVFGCGLTRLIGLIFFRHHFEIFSSKKRRESYWLDAKGYEPSRERLLKQV